MDNEDKPITSTEQVEAEIDNFVGLLIANLLEDVCQPKGQNKINAAPEHSMVTLEFTGWPVSMFVSTSQQIVIAITDSINILVKSGKLPGKELSGQQLAGIVRRSIDEHLVQWATAVLVNRGVHRSDIPALTVGCGECDNCKSHPPDLTFDTDMFPDEDGGPSDRN